ncbi:MAG TPA: hypothetical protein VFE62_04895 [Gemmataceae bacterium]|nr:hypothetical protein [Gemmataceae bacterium]
MQAPDGKMSAQCFHDSCQGRGWQAFKKQIGAPRARHYDGKRAKGRGKRPDKAGVQTARGGDGIASGPDDQRVTIVVTTKEHEVNDQAVAALGGAAEAIQQLLDVVADFPFESLVHKSAWLAALLTPLARFAFQGNAPLFLVDANVRASGKGLLLKCISHILIGQGFTVATYTSDEDELRKRITSIALAGDRLVLFDNLTGTFGNGTLDAALTTSAWEDRILGGNRMARVPLMVTWYATGNNVVIVADTVRRICHIRLESPEERPEERRDFKHPNILEWIDKNRQRLLAAALTVLRAYFVAGCPDQGLPAWGSFEGWSRIIRNALVWAGMPDPAETRHELQDRADIVAEGMGALIAAWERMDPERKGLTAAEVVHPGVPQAGWHRPPSRTPRGDA